jgi:hypothetical protein
MNEEGGLENKDQGLEDVDNNAAIVLNTSINSGESFKDNVFADEEGGIAEEDEECEEKVTLGACWTNFFLYLIALIHFPSLSSRYTIQLLLLLLLEMKVRRTNLNQKKEGDQSH